MTKQLSAGECPECAGKQLLDHPAGLLAIRHTLTCRLGQLDDQRRLADHQYARLTRKATPTERAILVGIYGDLDGDLQDADLETQVRAWSKGITRRDFPQLEEILTARATAPT